MLRGIKEIIRGCSFRLEISRIRVSEVTIVEVALPVLDIYFQIYSKIYFQNDWFDSRYQYIVTLWYNVLHFNLFLFKASVLWFDCTTLV